jgi:hypothetical protein
VAFEKGLFKKYGLDVQISKEASWVWPKRHCVEIHPEDISDFVEMAMYTRLKAVCGTVLGPEYKIAEIGFDVPMPGAVDQQLHRDFPAPDDTTIGRRLNSLAFNIITGDVYENMGSFEIAPGTQCDLPVGFDQGVFSSKECSARYRVLAQRKMPRTGDISALGPDYSPQYRQLLR